MIQQNQQNQQNQHDSGRAELIIKNKKPSQIIELDSLETSFTSQYQPRVNSAIDMRCRGDRKTNRGETHLNPDPKNQCHKTLV